MTNVPYVEGFWVLDAYSLLAGICVEGAPALTLAALRQVDTKVYEP